MGLFSFFKKKKTKNFAETEAYIKNYLENRSAVPEQADAGEKCVTEKTEAVMRTAKNEIRISYRQLAEPLPLGVSKFGGNPSVPKGFTWPRFTNMAECNAETSSLSFLAQIDLKEVSAYDTDGILPKDGILSFFYDIASFEWGYSPDHKGCARVYYFPEGTELTEMAVPDDIDKEFLVPEVAISFEKHISLPPYEGSPFEDEYDWDEYDEICNACGYDVDEIDQSSKLLGYPDQIQAPMEEECEIVSRGYSCGSSEDYARIPASEKEDIREKSKEWTLLFQMSTVSTDSAEIMFGDCGNVFFWIKSSDLQKMELENVWLVLQCG